MDEILITDLEVFFRVGVPEAERCHPQRLLISLELTKDLSVAARSDELNETINYSLVCQRIREFGADRSWHLIEKLAGDLCDLALDEFGATEVRVTVKKFIVPGTRHVAVRMTRGSS